MRCDNLFAFLAFLAFLVLLAFLRIVYWGNIYIRRHSDADFYQQAGLLRFDIHGTGREFEVDALIIVEILWNI